MRTNLIDGSLVTLLIGHSKNIAFTEVEDFNTFEVIAVDSAGNRSAPAAITLCMAAFCD